eukprot:UN18315
MPLMSYMLTAHIAKCLFDFTTDCCNDPLITVHHAYAMSVSYSGLIIPNAVGYVGYCVAFTEFGSLFLIYIMSYLTN